MYGIPLDVVHLIQNYLERFEDIYYMEKAIPELYAARVFRTKPVDLHEYEIEAHVYNSVMLRVIIDEIKTHLCEGSHAKYRELLMKLRQRTSVLSGSYLFYCLQFSSPKHKEWTSNDIDIFTMLSYSEIKELKVDPSLENIDWTTYLDIDKSDFFIVKVHNEEACSVINLPLQEIFLYNVDQSHGNESTRQQSLLHYIDQFDISVCKFALGIDPTTKRLVFYANPNAMKYLCYPEYTEELSSTKESKLARIMKYKRRGVNLKLSHEAYETFLAPNPKGSVSVFTASRRELCNVGPGFEPTDASIVFHDLQVSEPSDKTRFGVVMQECVQYCSYNHTSRGRPFEYRQAQLPAVERKVWIKENEDTVTLSLCKTCADRFANEFCYCVHQVQDVPHFHLTKNVTLLYPQAD